MARDKLKQWLTYAVSRWDSLNLMSKRYNLLSIYCLLISPSSQHFAIIQPEQIKILAKKYLKYIIFNEQTCYILHCLIWEY